MGVIGLAAERTIDVDYLARVEGEGSLFVRLVGGEVRDLKFKIFEPPRFFEALLRGRRFSEAPDITARICGICPVAYQMSACNAMEHAAGVEVDPAVDGLRRLLYCGEWIESHALHIFFLHAPDFLGYPGAVEMAEDFADRVETGLRLKKLGNAIMTVLGGREIHPVNVRVGGFSRAPKRAELDALVPELTWARDAAFSTVEWVAGFPFPDFERAYEFVALRHEGEYAIQRGRIVSNRGLDLAPAQWEETFEETQVDWSNALHARVRGRGAYHVGPMARYTLNHDLLTPLAAEAAAFARLGPSCTNPFKSIVVRAVEVVVACEEALRLIGAYRPPHSPFIAVDPAGATGHGATEAPRGILYHRYDVGDDGRIAAARIVPPTSQNQLSIEEDLRAFIPGRAGLRTADLQWRLEQAIRNYDPCISCATHFLDLTVERGASQ
jgi:coenzyme F420-reducing hydrogenase alpha subunit